MCPRNFKNPYLGNYLLDLIEIIKDETFDEMKRYRKTHARKIGSDKSYDEGRDVGFVEGCAFGYSRVISLMLQQAEAFV